MQRDFIDTEKTEDLTPEERFERKAQERLNRVEDILSEVSPGWKVTIYRVRPSWCRGWLETLDLIEDEKVDLQYLSETWGGEILRLRIGDEKGVWRGGADIPMMSYPPKVHGRILKRPTNSDFVDDSPARPNPSDSGSNALSMVLDTVSKLRKDDLSTIKSLLPTNAGGAGNPLSSIVETVEVLGQLNEMLGLRPSTAENNAPMNNDAAFMQSIVEMVKTVFNKGPRQPDMVIKPPIVQNPHPARTVPTQPTQPTQSNRGRSITDVLAGMNPTEAAEVFTVALGKMSVDKQVETINNIKSIFAGEIEEDDEDDNENGANVDDAGEEKNDG